MGGTQIVSKLTIATLLMLSMTTMMSNVAIVTTIPHLKEYFTSQDNIEFLSRMMLTLPSLCIALLAPFLGHFVHHFGKKRSVLLALFFFALFGSAGLYLESMASLLASRFLLGITVALLMIVTTSLVGDYFDGEARHKFMGLQSSFVAFGGVVFVFSGGVLADFHWRYAFGVYLIGLLLLPFAYRYIKDIKPQKTVDGLPHDPRLLKIYLLAFVLMLLFYILPTQMPFLIINDFKASSTLAGAIISSAFIFNALGALTFSKLKRHYSYRTIFLQSMAIIGLGFVLVGFIDNVYLFFITSPIMGFGGGIAMTNIVAWMLSCSDQSKRVKSSAYLTSALFFGQFLSPVFSQPIAGIIGIKFFFIFTGSLILLTLFLFITFKKSS